MNDNKLMAGLARLPAGDRRLLTAFVSLAVLALALGFVFGALTAFTRAGFIQPEPGLAYRLLSLHGVTIFFYWLYFAQAALVLVLTAAYTDGVRRIVGARAAWAGLGLMAGGFVLSEAMPVFGLSVLYDGQPGPMIGDLTRGGVFYLGYIALAVGLFLVGAVAVATALQPRWQGRIDTWSSVTFAAVGWAGLLMVSGLAALNVFGPAAWWAFGLGPEPAAYTMSWHVLFHNVHYLPLMATVLIWYVLVEAITGAQSIFGQRFSKVVFALYLIFVPPTSLYHMFLEPGLSEGVKMVGSLLSLFIGVPTVLVFLIITASLEAHARSQGGRGLFGWLRMLPWHNPAMAAVGMAVFNLALGGVMSFVLIQEKLAPLLSDTFFVPAYFHFLTLGTVTLSLVAALMYVVPGLTGRPLWRPGLLARMPYLVTLGLALFGSAGIAAGVAGVPRRVLDTTYEGLAPPLWGPLMTLVGVGGALMALGVAGYVVGLAVPLLRVGGRGDPVVAGLHSVAWRGAVIGRQAAWFGPLSVLVLIVAMYGFTVLGFELIQNLPVNVTGGHGGH